MSAPIPGISGVLGHYRIVEKIGEGGMGVVYRAHDESLDRDVALKVLPASSFRDPSARARLLREARTASQLNHPNICTIHEVGEADGQAYIAMEFVQGQTLSALVAAGPLRAENVLHYGLQLVEALEHAHERGVLHRDLKGANVVITGAGRAKVLDFGLAKRFGEGELEEVTRSQTSLTAPGALVGTLAYMAPEQFRGLPADARSDVWALGVVLYEMATGTLPFHGQTGFELSSAILKETAAPMPVKVPMELRMVIERCLEKGPGRRYQRASEVRAALETIQTGTVIPWAAWRHQLARRRWLALATMVVLILLILAALNFDRLRAGPGGAPVVESLAVLPLEYLSGDAQQDYLAEGVHEALITDLAKLSGMRRVIARASVIPYRKTTKPLPQIARELGVDALITGSVLRSGDRVQITAHLIQAATQQQLWSDRYERQLRDVLSLQNDIVAAITRAIQSRLTPQEQVQLAQARPVNPEAYDAYLKGKFYLNKMTPEGYEKGLAYLNQAVAIDPTNPLPYAALALGYSLVGHERYPDAFARAKAAARKAEELGGENLAEMYLATGMTKLYSDWDYPGAEKDLRRAMVLNPSLGDAHRNYSWYLFLIGRQNEALAEMKRAQEVDPLTPLFYADRGWQYWWAGQNENAIKEARKSLELDPNFNEGLHVLGALYAEEGRYPEAIAAHQKLAAVDPDWRWSLIRTYVLAGRGEEARKTLARYLAEKPAPTGAWAGWFLAEGYVALGDKDGALRWLEAAYRERHSFLPWLRQDPVFAPLHDDPRFQEMVRRTNTPR